MSAISSLTSGAASGVNGSSSTGSTGTGSSATSTGNATLNSFSESDFLQLLVAQMQNQDPTSPMSATDFMTELADFSSVEGINNLQNAFTSNLPMQSLTEGANLIGSTVGYTDAKGADASGVVDSVSISNGQVQLSINNTDVALSQVLSVAPTS